MGVTHRGGKTGQLDPSLAHQKQGGVGWFAKVIPIEIGICPVIGWISRLTRHFSIFFSFFFVIVFIYLFVVIDITF